MKEPDEAPALPGTLLAPAVIWKSEPMGKRSVSVSSLELFQIMIIIIT